MLQKGKEAKGIKEKNKMIYYIYIIYYILYIRVKEVLENPSTIITQRALNTKANNTC